MKTKQQLQEELKINLIEALKRVVKDNSIPINPIHQYKNGIQIGKYIEFKNYITSRCNSTIGEIQPYSSYPTIIDNNKISFDTIGTIENVGKFNKIIKNISFDKKILIPNLTRKVNFELEKFNCTSILIVTPDDKEISLTVGVIDDRQEIPFEAKENIWKPKNIYKFILFEITHRKYITLKYDEDVFEIDESTAQEIIDMYIEEEYNRKNDKISNLFR